MSTQPKDPSSEQHAVEMPLEDVLDAYAVAGPSQETLHEWIRRYPQYEEQLTDFTVRWSVLKWVPRSTGDEASPDEEAFMARGMDVVDALLAQQQSETPPATTLMEFIVKRLFRFAEVLRTDICYACGEKFENVWDDVVFLSRRRDPGWVEPEEPVFWVHASCVDHFVQERGGMWDQSMLRQGAVSWAESGIVGAEPPLPPLGLKEPVRSGTSMSGQEGNVKISVWLIEQYFRDPASLDEEAQILIRKALDESAFASEVARFFREFHDLLDAQIDVICQWILDGALDN